ncbi:hypothetical protein B0H12DRAFT_1151677, partial [Mycena haematopus]
MCSDLAVPCLPCPDSYATLRISATLSGFAHQSRWPQGSNLSGFCSKVSQIFQNFVRIYCM